MNSKGIVKDIMKKQDIGNAQMAKRLSISPQSMYDRLNNTSRIDNNGNSVSRDLNVQSLNEILKALDYKIIIAPSNSKVPSGGYVVE